MVYVSWVRTRVYPELRLFRNRTERRVAWRKAAGGLPWRVEGAAGLVICCWLAFLGYSPFLDWIEPYPSGVELGILGVSSFIPLAIVIPIVRAPIRRRLRRELIDIGIHVCVQCCYDLRSLPEPRCPECGTPFPREKGDSTDAARVSSTARGN